MGIGLGPGSGLGLGLGLDPTRLYPTPLALVLTLLGWLTLSFPGTMVRISSQKSFGRTRSATETENRSPFPISTLPAILTFSQEVRFVAYGCARAPCARVCLRVTCFLVTPIVVTPIVVTRCLRRHPVPAYAFPQHQQLNSAHPRSCAPVQGQILHRHHTAARGRLPSDFRFHSGQC